MDYNARELLKIANLPRSKGQPLSDRNVPPKPSLVDGVEGHTMNETTSFPGSLALRAGSFVDHPGFLPVGSQVPFTLTRGSFRV